MQQGPSRRGFFGVAGGLAGALLPRPRPRAARLRHMLQAAAMEPFYGAHQGGITTPMQSNLYFASFDLTAENRQEVIAMLQGWTVAAARMSAGLPAVPGEQDEQQPAFG